MGKRTVSGRAAFRAVWKLVAQAGGCDAPDGAEYRRVFNEWVRAGKPAGLELFIRARCRADEGGLSAYTTGVVSSLLLRPPTSEFIGDRVLVLAHHLGRQSGVRVPVAYVRRVDGSWQICAGYAGLQHDTPVPAEVVPPAVQAAAECCPTD